MKHIFQLWPSLNALADDLQRPYPTVAAWKQRGSIPAEYDLALIEAARKRGQDLTLEQLALARRDRASEKTKAADAHGTSDASERGVA